MSTSNRLPLVSSCVFVFVYVALAYASKDANDTTRDRIVMDFSRMCPYTDMCYSPAKDNFTPSFGRMTIKEPCCRGCSCEEGCGLNCCPDARNHSVTTEELEELKTNVYGCIYPQYRPYHKKKANAVWSFDFIDRCPSGYNDKDVVRLCLQDYWQFDLNTDFSKMLPVTSVSESVTYKNSFCRLCHDANNGSNDAHMLTWRPAIACTLGTLTISSVSEIREKLVEDRYCNLVFNQPDSLPYRLHRCSQLIDECNVTGNWAKYDEFLEKACFSYKSVYAYDYKNVHCFLCNGFTVPDIENVCEPDGAQTSRHSFIALLDFNNYEDTSKTEEADHAEMKKCEPDTELDPLTDMCLSLRCAKGMQLSGSKCSPVYNQLKTLNQQNNVPMEIIMTYEAIGIQRKMGYAYDTIDHLSSSMHMSFYPFKRMSNFVDEICEVGMFVQLDRPFPLAPSTWDELYMNGNWTNYISYIATRMLLQTAIEDVSAVTNVSELLEDVAALFLGDRWGRYEIRFRDIDSGLFKKHAYDSVPSADGLLLDPSVVPLKKIAMSDYCPDSFITIEPDPFCGKVCIPQTHVVGFSNSQVQFDINGTRLSFSRYILDDAAKCVYVCWNSYKEQVTKALNHCNKIGGYEADTYEQIPNDVNNAAMVILTIVCLVCSLLSLILTVIVYSMLPSLRTVPGLNNMALSVSVFAYQSLMLVNSSVEIQLSSACTVIGLCLHFFLIYSFFWMFICTFHMAKVFVNISNKSAVRSNRGGFIRYSLISTIGSLLLTISVVIKSAVESPESELSIGYGGSPCYLKDPRMILYFVAIPLVCMLLVNFAMFITVVVKVSRLPDMGVSSTRERKNLFIFAKLSTITGMTWGFGLLYQFTGFHIFAYMYVILNGGQGVFIFTAFVANSRVLRLLKGERASHYSRSGNGHTRGSTLSAVGDKSNSS